MTDVKHAERPTRYTRPHEPRDRHAANTHVRFGGTMVPFMDQFLGKITRREKWATSRPFPLVVGRTYHTKNGIHFRVTQRHRLTIRQIADDHWQAEGVASPEEFINVWKRLHNRKVFDPDRKVFYHEFELVEVPS